MVVTCHSSLQEEISRLRLKVMRLTAKVAALNTPTISAEEAELAQLMLQHTALAAIARSQQFQVAKAQSLLTQRMSEQNWNPLSTSICLGKESAERRAALLEIRPQKLLNAYEYITSACPLEDTMVPQYSDERFETGSSQEPRAVIAIDSVDQDALHPYIASERVRREISVAVLLTANDSNAKEDESYPSASSMSEDGGLVVTMRRVTFLKLHNPEFPVSKAALQELQMDVALWSNLALKTMRDVLKVPPK
ncbi:hypothetical protein PHYSODRAFT_303904 [Phytophthora sojae]|uniref:Uncharacterized protein n=1 Tax=Phytophthora sojae (strain P6497) TaxID=1094619 RepID=G4ZYV6_PHYSP|nr:hypothetical protein PHYSODRAFT_303904 [Phytophthora sojae]EGZ12139.1 hypothetical protein PHYSODRAFT_303904 [Phytophthora sojae]|eukprot:XP_009532472.1 hypothetical protein PHYSODRAFT_303904 [Phytophthora sojae]